MSDEDGETQTAIDFTKTQTCCLNNIIDRGVLKKTIKGIVYSSPEYTVNNGLPNSNYVLLTYLLVTIKILLIVFYIYNILLLLVGLTYHGLIMTFYLLSHGETY